MDRKEAERECMGAREVARIEVHGDDEDTDLEKEWQAIKSELVYSNSTLKDFSRLHPNANLNELVVYRRGNDFTGVEKKDTHETLSKSFAAGQLLPFCENKRTDFVATDRELKKMFEISLSPESTSCSLLVQRVGNVLVLDGTWKGPILPPSEVRNEESIQSKFLFYSVKEAHQVNETDDQDHEEDSALPSSTAGVKMPRRVRRHRSVTKDKAVPLNVLDDSDDDQYLPKKRKGSSFQRVLRWCVGEFNIVLGSNLLIVKDEDEKNVSVRLRDVKDVLSAKVCLDAWLDNKMNGVENTAVCFHKEGIVQGYQIVSNEELLVRQEPGSSSTRWFRPKAISDGACNIMSFLKRHCQEDGATYYLYKEKGGKDLCLFQVLGRSEPSPEARAGEEQLVTVRGPVAGLYYRLAQRLLEEDPRSEKAGQLLEKSISLLEPICKPNTPWISASQRLAAIRHFGIYVASLESLSQIFMRRAQDLITGEELKHQFVRLEPVASAWEAVDTLKRGMQYLTKALEATLRFQAAQRQRLCPTTSDSKTEPDAENVEFQIDGEPCELVQKRLRKKLFLCYVKIGLQALKTGAPGRIRVTLKSTIAAVQVLDPASARKNADLTLFLAASALAQWFLFDCKDEQVIIGQETAPVDLFHGVLLDPSETTWVYKEESGVFKDLNFLNQDPLSTDTEEVLQNIAHLLLRCLTNLRVSSGRRALLLRQDVLCFLFDIQRAVGKQFLDTGRVTKAFRHWSQVVQLFKGLQSETFVLAAELEQFALQFQTFCGVDLSDPEVIRPLTLVAVATDAESTAAQFGVHSDARETSCSLNPQTYTEQLASANALISKLLDCSAQGNLDDEQREKGVHFITGALVRFAIVDSRCGDQQASTHTMTKLLDKFADVDDVLLNARLHFAMGLVAVARNRHGKNKPLDRKQMGRLIGVAVKHFEKSLDLLVKASCNVDADDLGVDGVVIRVELARTLQLLWEDQGRPQHCKSLLDSIDVLIGMGFPERSILDAALDEGQDSVHIQVVGKLLTRGLLELCKSQPQNTNYKDAYRSALELSASSPTGPKPSTVLERMDTFLHS